MKFVLRTRSLWNALSAGNRLNIGQRHISTSRGRTAGRADNRLNIGQRHIRELCTVLPTLQIGVFYTPNKMKKHQLVKCSTKFNMSCFATPCPFSPAGWTTPRAVSCSSCYTTGFHGRPAHWCAVHKAYLPKNGNRPGSHRDKVCAMAFLHR